MIAVWWRLHKEQIAVTYGADRGYIRSRAAVYLREFRDESPEGAVGI